MSVDKEREMQGDSPELLLTYYEHKRHFNVYGRGNPGVRFPPHWIADSLSR